MRLQQTQEEVAFTVALAAALTLIAAWGFQIIGGYVPCPLCLQQRWAWYVVMPLGVAVALYARNWPGNIAARAGFVLIALILLAGAGLGVYQSGAEWKFWPGPNTCSGGGGISGVLPNLENARVVRCDEAQWRFLGLSFAGWNVVLSLVVAALSLRGAGMRGGTGNQGSSSVSQ